MKITEIKGREIEVKDKKSQWTRSRRRCRPLQGVLSKFGFHEWVMKEKHPPFSFELNKVVVSTWHLSICLNFEGSLHKFLNSSA